MPGIAGWKDVERLVNSTFALSKNQGAADIGDIRRQRVVIGYHPPCLLPAVGCRLNAESCRLAP